jgi:hypothetical protein
LLSIVAYLIQLQLFGHSQQKQLDSIPYLLLYGSYDAIMGSLWQGRLRTSAIPANEGISALGTDRDTVEG